MCIRQTLHQCRKRPAIGQPAQAYENADLHRRLEEAIHTSASLHPEARRRLLKVLQTGSLPPEQVTMVVDRPKLVAMHR